MKIEAYKADNGIIFETEYECIVENTRIKILNFLNPPSNENKLLIAYDTLGDIYRSRFAEEMAKKILNERPEFMKLFNELLRIEK